ncbi:MAG: hydrolase [Treponema sp.]|jgi:predicted hydrolase (HD superfamily)|nr:hydrolase [Treponema sp.]
MTSAISREAAWELLCKHNKDTFHLQHALTVEGVMKWYAGDLGHAGETDYWGMVGLLHDIDFEEYPDQHCLKAPELLRAECVSEEMIRSICSHGWGITGVDTKPEHKMEKVLFAADELTGIVWAAAIIRPSKSVQDMEVKSLKKKFKSPAFAAGCSREVIEKGAALLGWELDTLLEKTILAMRSCEDSVNVYLGSLAQ